MERDRGTLSIIKYQIPSLISFKKDKVYGAACPSGSSADGNCEPNGTSAGLDIGYCNTGGVTNGGDCLAVGSDTN